jgi:hypothetical protein
MSDDLTCDSCSIPTGGARLCERCKKTLAIALVNAAAYYDDLGTIAGKRARYGSQMATKGSIGKEQPLPADTRFLDIKGDGTQVRYDVWASVVAWCRVVMEEAGPPLMEPACRTCEHLTCGAIRRRRWPRNTIRSMIAYFDRQWSFIVRSEWVATFLDEMLDNEKRLRRLVDRPADRWYAGKCSATDESGEHCNAELYATQDRGTIDCRACGIRHDVADRRDFLLAEAKDYLVTATEAAKALMSWTEYDGSENKLVDRICKWRDRDQLEIRDVTSLNGRDRHLYRLGDIQKLLIGDAQDTQARRVATVAP